MEVILGYPMWLGCVFVVGACIGSYLNVVIYRWPIEDLSVSKPQRSFCPICRKEIPWYRNLPIATWILQRAKCAECGAPISFRYVFVEIFTALSGSVGRQGSQSRSDPLSWVPRSALPPREWLLDRRPAALPDPARPSGPR